MVEAFNIGNGGEEISILDLARQCAAACGLPASAVQYDPQAKAGGLARCVPDTSAISRVTNTAGSFTALSVGLPVLRDWANFSGAK